MKQAFIFFTQLLLLTGLAGYSQNGKIVQRETIDIKSLDDLKPMLYTLINGRKVLKPKYKYIDLVKAERILYLSDGLKVTGFLVSPKKPGIYPGIIYNRGGNKEFGKITSRKVAFILARVASWGYVVAGSQYRGNDGGEGNEEFGGKDVDDVLNLIPLLQNSDKVDSSKLGIYGWSRGGMMTYLALQKTSVFKAAVVGGGLSDLTMMMSSRPDMEEVYYDVIPGYAKHKTASLDARSAIKNVDKIPKTTPILMLHGTADWRVVPQMALDLASSFQKSAIPYRLILFEGGDHGLSEHTLEVDQQVKAWFNRYVKDGEKLPNLHPHGK